MIYVLKATLLHGMYMPEDTEVTRTYRIGGSATLDDLCHLILKSVDFDLDHLYEFRIDSHSLYEGKVYTRMPKYPGEKSTKAKLYNIGLKKDTPFVFHYDFGDDWAFQLMVLDVLNESGNITPSILASEGQVEQYPDWEEDDFAFSDEDTNVNYDDDEYYDDFDGFPDDPADRIRPDRHAKNQFMQAEFLVDKYSDDIDFSDEYFMEDDEVITEESNPRFGRFMIRIAEHQIETGNPPFVTEAYKRFQLQGDYRKLAKVKIANGLIKVIYDMMTEGVPYQDSLYEDALLHLDFDELDPELIYKIETGTERKLGQIFLEIDQNLNLFSEEETAAEMFLHLWPLLKEWVLDNFARETADGLQVLSPSKIEEMTDYRLSLFNVLQEIDQAFLNTRRYEDGLTLFPDILETFSWEDGENSTLKAAVGECLERLGRQMEADIWFRDWYAESPDNPWCTNYYVLLLQERGDLASARQVLEEHLPDKPEPDVRNIDLYTRASELYSALGDKSKSRLYNNLAERSQRVSSKKSHNNIVSFPFGTPVTAQPKIYPNDPCPCGSGKKYKKCCGRKKK